MAGSRSTTHPWWVRALAALAACSVLVAACGGDDDESSGTTTPADTDGDDTAGDGDVDPDGVLRHAYDLVVAAVPGGLVLDPAQINTQLTNNGMLYMIYGSLLRRTADGALEPDLAETTEIVDDATIEITLRDGLTFSDGTPFDADAVVAGLLRTRDEGSREGLSANFLLLEAAEAVSPTEVRLTIGDAGAAAWHDSYLGSWETSIVKPGQSDFDLPVGAGPMILTDWTKEQSMTFAKNSDYWDADAVLLGGIEVTHAPSDSTAGSAALTAGQVDLAAVSVEEAARFDDDAILQQPTQERGVHMMTCKRDEPLDDVRVRKALNLAIDRELLNEAAFGGYFEPITGLWPDGHRFNNPDVTLEHDPDEARALLAEAGYADGVEIDVYVIQAQSMPTAAEVLQQMLAEVGVEMNIIPATDYVGQFLVAAQPGLGLVPAWGADKATLDQWSGETVANTCAYVDPDIDAMVEELNGLSDSDPQTQELWWELEEKIIEEDALSVFLAFGTLIAGYDPDRVGQLTPMPFLNLWPDVRETYISAS